MEGVRSGAWAALAPQEPPPVAGRRPGRVLIPAAWCLPLPPRRLMDGRARPHLLSFDLRRAPQGAGLVAAGRTSHSPLAGAPAASKLSSRHG
jgi:hypothetical protein